MSSVPRSASHGLKNPIRMYKGHFAIAGRKLAYVYFEDDEPMSQLLLQVLIVARYNWQTGKWEWGEPPSRPY